jgi:hypothetical protein
MADATRFQFTNPAVPKAYEEYFLARLREELATLLVGGKVVGEMVSNIIVARRR